MGLSILNNFIKKNGEIVGNTNILQITPFAFVKKMLIYLTNHDIRGGSYG